MIAFEAIFLFGLTGAVIVLLINTLINVYKKYDTRHKNRTYAITQAESSSRTSMISEYVYETGIKEYKTQRDHNYVVYETFMQALREYFVVTVSFAACKDKNSYCNYLLKLVGKQGNVFYLAFNTSNQSLYTIKRQMKMESEIPLVNYLDDEECFVMSSGIEYIHQQTLTEDNDDIIALEEIIHRNRVQYIEIEDNHETHRVFRFIKTKEGYRLAETTVPVSIVPKNVLDNMYCPMPIEFENKIYEFKAGDAVRIAADSIEAGSNLFMWGVMGGGKTSYATQIAARLSKRRGINVVMLSPSVLRELQFAEAQAGLLSAFAESTQEGYTNVLVVDEAESLLRKADDGIHTEDASFVLQLLSGDIGKQLNLRMIMTFNASPEQLNDKLFRAGRKGLMFEVKPLQAEQARRFVHELRGSLIEKEFNPEKFEKLLNEENKSVNGVTYAKAGEITLADVYDCFMTRSTASIIRQILERESGDKEERVVLTSPKVRHSEFIRPIAELADDVAPSIPHESHPKPKTHNGKHRHKKRNR